MKLKDYAEKLSKLAERCPDVEVIYSGDDEGNDFQAVSYSPTLGFYEKGEFRSYDPDNKDTVTINAVCLN